MGYTSDDLISRMRLWSASSTGTPPSVTDADALDMLNSEMSSVIVPMIMDAHGEWLVDYDDYAISHASDVMAVSLPSRAVLGKVREVKIYDASAGVYYDLPLLTIAQLEDNKKVSGVYFVGNTMYLTDAGRWPTTYVLRVYYYRRPNDLVLSTAAGQVTDTTGGYTVGSASSLFGASATLDFIQHVPPFELLAADVACTISGNLITPTVDPGVVVVGAWASLSGTSPVAMIPYEYHNILCQSATMKLLEVAGDGAAIQIAGAKFGQMSKSVASQAVNRIQGEARRIVSRRPLF